MIGRRMDIAATAKRRLPAFAIAIVALAVWAPASGDAAATAGCPSFDSQAAAQTYFMEHRGSPGHGIGRLDPDADGVACEGLGAPYQGFATIGYNKKRDFFFGVASMPPLASGNGEYACLAGNRHWADGPRWLGVYRVKPDGDVAVFGSHKISAEAKPDLGKLIWKADKDLDLPGRYYVAFEESVRTSPYGRNPCPEFRSRAIRLP
jgi:hypothetical protein